MQNLLNKIYTISTLYLRDLFSTNNSHSIAIDINSSNIRLLELSKQKNNYRLEKFICEPLSLQINQGNNEDIIIQVLKNIIAKNNLKSRNAAIAISYSGTIAKTITLPPQLKENEIEEFLALNIEQHINISADKISFDYQLLTAPNYVSQTAIELLAARKENIDKYKTLLETIGLKAKIIDIDAHALVRIGNLLALEPASTSAFINLESEKILIVICKQNKLIYAQEYFVEHYIFHDTEILATQISNNLKLCLTAINQPINTITLCGTHATINGLSATLQKISHIKTILADPFCAIVLPNHINKAEIMKKASIMALCCGLALWKKHDFNLLPWRQILHAKKQRIFKSLVCCGIILGFLTIAIWHFLLTQTINSATVMQRNLLPRITALQQQEKQIKVTTDKIAEIKNKLARIKSLQNNQIENVTLLTTLSQITPPTIYLLNLQKNNDAITINGQTTNLSAITEFMQKISKASIFSQPQIQEIKNLSEQENAFGITTDLKHSN